MHIHKYVITKNLEKGFYNICLERGFIWDACIYNVHVASINVYLERGLNRGCVSGPYWHISTHYDIDSSHSLFFSFGVNLIIMLKHFE